VLTAMLAIVPDPTPDTACIILARGGSKGLPGKNLRPVGGVSLIGRAVRAGRTARSVAAVYVSTDDAGIAAEAALHGARIIDRPAALSGDTASSEEGWLHAATFARADFPALARLVFLQCTSPFIAGADIDGCLAAMAKNGADCALSVTEDHAFLWGLDAQGRGVGTNHNHREQRKRRQDLPPQYRESGAIYCVALEPFLRTGQRFCGSVALYPVDHPPIEIDTQGDLALCSMIAQSRANSGVEAGRLARVKAIVMDFDGVHTDNLVIVDQNGVETVRASRGDGMGIAALRDSDRYRMMILSTEKNPVVLRRGEKLGIEVHNGVEEKEAFLQEWLAAQGLTWHDLLYVGNDINDRQAMQNAGLSACPSDSHPEILGLADWILPAPGGNGALRAMADAILAGSANQNG
jgi:YrbI family 3-deoxy-D-manno-octulosonate 8-phosphate phosphatase